MRVESRVINIYSSQAKANNSSRGISGGGTLTYCASQVRTKQVYSSKELIKHGGKLLQNRQERGLNLTQKQVDRLLAILQELEGIEDKGKLAKVGLAVKFSWSLQRIIGKKTNSQDYRLAALIINTMYVHYNNPSSRTTKALIDRELEKAEKIAPGHPVIETLKQKGLGMLTA